MILPREEFDPTWIKIFGMIIFILYFLAFAGLGYFIYHEPTDSSTGCESVHETRNESGRNYQSPFG